jgi:serpin B
MRRMAWMSVALAILFAPNAKVEAGGRENGSPPVSAVVSGNSRFALELYSRLGAASEDKNLFFSPFSISTALAMTYGGSHENTARQMAAVLHFDALPEDLHESFSSLIKAGNASGSKESQLNTANALWVQQGHPVKPEYLALVRDYYQGGFRPVDLRNPERSSQIINAWVAEKTAGKITGLLQPADIDRSTVMVLSNAIYFKGRWISRFETAETASAPFTVTAGKTVSAPLMRQKGSFFYAATGKLQILELPYTGGDLSLLVLLPKNGIDELGSILTLPQLREWQAQLRPQEVEVFLPKFKVETRISLKNTLAAMGMADAFSKRDADFSGIMDPSISKIFINLVIHQAVVEVNEEGTEAAAATAIGGPLSLRRPAVFRADHPFVFAILQKSTGSILFIGRMCNPMQA